jgi:ABC-type multidrug transport system ATPase subunit
MLSMYDEIVEFAELEKFMDQKLKNYSSGMQVRLAFSIAIRANSDILLLDEVLAVGDINFQKKCFNYFKGLKDKNKTVIFVSHDMSAVKEYCDNGILLDMSKMVPTNDFKEVIDKYMKIMNPRSTGNTAVKTKSIKNQIEIIDQKITITKQETKLSLKIKFHGPYKDTKFYSAFSVKNNIEQRIFGTSTEIYVKPMKPTKIQNEFVIEWTLLSVLSKGSYSVNVSVSSSDKSSQATFEDILKFDIKDAKENYYSINPVTDLLIK